MGQKTNPNILRTGKIKEWKSKYIEKKPTESSIVVFRDLEIKKFISQLFVKNELKVQNCRIYYSENSLYIYISYYNSFNPAKISKRVKPKYADSYSKIFQKKALSVKRTIMKRQVYAMKNYKKTFSQHTKIKLFQNQYLLNQKTQRLNTLDNLAKYGDIRSHKTLNQQCTNLFISKILKSLSLFTDKKHNIFLNLKQINKETTFLEAISKKKVYKLEENLARLRRFHQNEFFKKGFNVLCAFAMNAHGSLFLAEFIAIFLKKFKRPNFFLRFLKIALKTLSVEKFARFERVQIKIKGRFNGVPRSSHKFINIGRNIPVLTLNSKINYGESTAYTSNGTFGIKVWTYTKGFKL